MSIRYLHEGWTVSSAAHQEVPATVPGCVHTDLLSAGLIPDPYLDDNETKLTWIGRTDWSYTTAFEWQPEGFEHVDLAFEGLDTIATVLLNGTEIGRTANMHRSYRFSVSRLLVPGTNRLEVQFTAPYSYTGEMQERLGSRPGPYDEPYQFIRKMACNFGWDWGPTLVTSGIWKPVSLHSWSGVRIASVRPLLSVDGTSGKAAIHVALEGDGDAVVSLAGQTAPVVDGVALIEVADVALWWPRGFGAQPLYDLTVRAGDSVWQKKVGFRTVEVDLDAFRFIVNGRPVFARGFNWIPDDCFPHRVTPERLRERFTQAIETNANTLRVWGGGLYESDTFYDLADELGVMVWQDFPFACAAYPEDDPLWTEVEAEARENVTRLMTHPSLLLWCGNNENIEGYQHWDWQEELGQKTWGAGYYYDLLPRVMSEVDPTRVYWPGSPYSGDPDRDARDPSTGTIHIWTVWNQQDYTHYGTYTPRFVAEYGFQGPPAYATLTEAISGPLSLNSPLLAQHQKAFEGADKLLRGLGDHLPQPETFDDWHYYTQLNQARALSFGVQRFRSLMPYCMGTIVWQLNDCWPVISWAAIDGAARRKPLWYALRRSFADRLLSFHEDGIAIVNDTDQPWTGELTLTRRALTGEPLAKEGIGLSVPPRDVAIVKPSERLTAPGVPANEMLVAELGTHRALKMFAEDPVMDYPPAAFDADVRPSPAGLTVRITARTLLRELAIFPDRLDPAAEIDDQLVTLLPGESVTFHIRTSAALAPDDLLNYPVLRCVNERKDSPPCTVPSGGSQP